MPVKPRSTSKPRRTPKQQRSVEAVAAIFEATGKLIDAEGLTGLTIARIGEIAGYGAGTVYDYFPTKTAILIAMARRELDGTVQAIEAAILGGNATAESEVSRAAIRAMIGGFGGRRRLRGVLLGTMIAEGHGAELARPVDRIVDVLTRGQQPIDDVDPGGLNRDQLYVLTRVLVGAIRAWAMEGGDQVSPEALEIELTEVARGYVRQCLTSLTPST